MSGIHRDDRPALIALGLVLVAIVLICALGLLSRYQPSDQQPDTNRSGAQYEDGQHGPSEGHWWPEFSARDTYAQWAMTGLALVATIISIVGVFLIRQTFIETKRTAEAAVEANSTARDIGEKQIRAYISVGSVEIVPKDPPNKSVLKVRVIIRNHGQTSAHDLVCEICAGVGIISGSGPVILPRPNPMPRPSRMTLPGGLAHQVVVETPPMSVSEFPFLADLYAAIANGDVEFYVWGWAQYKDVFGHDHETTIQWFWDKASVAAGTGFRADSIGNRET